MEAKSLGDLLRRSCQRWGDKSAMQYPTKDGYQSISYSELARRVRCYAGALQRLGLKRGDHICIQSENGLEWAFTDWACQCLGITLVPIYPTLPADQSQYIVKDSEAKLVLSSTPEQAEKMEGSGVKTLLLKDAAGCMAELATEEGAISEGEWNAEIDKAAPEDLATIIYTSGTTGPPKGAMLANRAFTFICEQAILSLPVSDADTFLSFLPMSHVYERVAGQALPISLGATIAYAKSLMTLANDIQKVKPTIMLCVPRFLEATKDKITDTAHKEGGLKAKLFDLAVKEGGKRANGKFSLLAPLLNGIVGSKIRAKMGGRMRFFVSGGAALAPSVADFYRGLGIDLLQGYGLTETAAASCVNHPARNKPWTVGEPIPGVEVKIAADGEILIGGPSRMIGYWNLPEATAQAIDAEGWFHTGDIGEFEGKHLKITDRKKDLLVLANGKNIAPQPIENQLKESNFISEAVLFGDGNEYVYALILPNWEHVQSHLGVKGEPAQLADKPEVKSLIKKEVDAVNSKLADFERVKKHCIFAGTFSIDSGELTPSFKVKRKVVREKYADLLKTMER